MESKAKPVILLAEDDDDDFLLTRDALEEAGFEGTLERVRDGDSLIDYLFHRGPFADPKKSPRPAMVLLDLNMPRRDGREALREIKSDPHLKRIPVVVLTTSKAEQDICKTYELGGNSFVHKPVSFDDFVELLRIWKRYWLEIAQLPPS